MKAQIGLIRGVGFTPGVVRVATGGTYSHVIIGVGNGQVISPQLGGAALREACDYPTAVWSQYPLTGFEEEAIADYARARERSPYNLLGAAAIAAARLNYRIRFHYPDRAYAFYHCAQLAYAAYTAAGLDPIPGLRVHPGGVSPRDFEREFERQGWLIPRRAVPQP